MAFFSTTWKHIRRSPYQAFAAIFIIMQTFFVGSIFAFIIIGSAKVISHFESQPQVTAFFKDEAKQEDISTLKKKVEETGLVAKSRFVDKNEALKIYQRIFRDDPLLLEFVTADILPASLEISTKRIEDLAKVSEILKKNGSVRDVMYPKDIIKTLTTWTNALRKVGIALVGFLIFDSIFLMIIIIGIKISQKKDEIEIMRLLGATNWYVRWPFIFEGTAYGTVGAFFGWLFASGVLWYATPFLSSFLKDIPLLPASPLFLFEMLVVELLLAVLLGTASSFLAVLRYLK